MEGVSNAAQGGGGAATGHPQAGWKDAAMGSIPSPDPAACWELQGWLQPSC